MAGLARLREMGAHDDDWVLVHDAARCMIRPEWVRDLLRHCANDEVGGLLAMPMADTMKRGDGPHSGNPDVKKLVLEEKKPAVVAWAVERKDGGRGFGFTGGHYHAGWSNESQRTLVLNAIVWTAKAEVPAAGVVSKFTEEELKANQDKKVPRKAPKKK
jgi:hypothetical protein